MFPGNLAGWHRSFDNREERLPRHSIEHEQEPSLVDDDDSGNSPAIALDVDKRGRRLGVVVPDIVMDRLEIPQQFSGGSLHGDDGCTEEVVARPIRSDSIEIRSPK